MSLPSNAASNETEIAYWNGAGGRNWVRRQQGQDAILAPISQAAIERATVRPGERVVDIGCGTGATSIELGERVGPSGHVLGVDVSEPMLARATERLPAGAPVKFVRADATTHQFQVATFDLLFSRFGVMFSLSQRAPLRTCAMRCDRGAGSHSLAGARATRIRG